MRNDKFNFQRTALSALLGFIIILVALSVCNKPKKKTTSAPPEIPIAVREFCTRMPLIKITGREPAFVLNYKRQWLKPIALNVYFFGTNYPGVTERVLKIANEWSAVCGMSFTPVTKMSDSQIRITFAEGGYASAVGREVLEDKYDHKFTMCLQGLDTLQDTAVFRRVILHEFGHALGLEHELQSPSANIPWDTAALYKYYYDHYRWQPDSVLHQVLTKLENVYYTGFDSSSIMVYAVPDTLTKGAYEIRWPAKLSVTDKTEIGKWYPKKNKP